MGKRIYILVGSFIVIILLGVSIYSFLLVKRATLSSYTNTTAAVQANRRQDYITYGGKNGKTAQQLLLDAEKGKVTFDSSGMVATINTRSADAKKHEYWAFYVNGKMSSVGALAYVTKDSDNIEWKIETY